MGHIPSIRPYSTETVVSSTRFFHFLALIFLSFGIYASFVCVYNVRTSLFWRNKIIHCLISRRVSEKIDNSIQMLHENASWKWKIMLYYRKTGHFSRYSKKQGNFILRLCALCSSELDKVFFFDCRIECVF